MMKKYLFAFDLDGTLLNSDKEISKKDLKTLYKASEAGVVLVPSTGRFFNIIPQSVKELPFIRYIISINGACVMDTKTGEVVYKAEIPVKKAKDIMEFLDGRPLIYDCYAGNRAFMTKDFFDLIDIHMPDIHYNKILRQRTPVEELKKYIEGGEHDIQKIQIFAIDKEYRMQMIKEIPEKFSDIIVTSALSTNAEINHKDANKGRALLKLADVLGIEHKNTIAIGDGLNDVKMIEAAGVGVAMENAVPKVKKVADFITLNNDESGVSVAIEKFCLNG